MIKFLYKWLPITFGCHCRKDRSFHYKGKQFPICARCTGELFGMIAGIILICFGKHFSIPVCILLMLPLLIDGFTQALTKYESNNIKRVITGFIFGIPFVMMIAKIFLLGRFCGIKFMELIKNMA